MKRRHHAFKAVVVDVSTDADDLVPNAEVVVTGAESLADRVLIRKELLRGTLVDDGDGLSPIGVLGLKSRPAIKGIRKTCKKPGPTSARGDINGLTSPRLK
ncbi:MAG TPA: hypothetical protein VK638_44730 [Edaphobacter sp.]|nr:hypothetical protein [Edaphobacter sp.]